MIPLCETRITVQRYASTDAYETRGTASVVAMHVRAVIGTDTGTEAVTGGTQEDVRASLRCDPIDLTHADRVLDETTGLEWEVVWCRPRPGLGLAHVVGELRQISGARS